MPRCILSALTLLAVCIPLHGQTEEMQTLIYLRHRQTPDGGFTASTNEKKAALGPTSAAVRALKYFGGEVPKAEACKKFVAGCFDKESGGFRPTPGEGKPDVFTT